MAASPPPTDGGFRNPHRPIRWVRARRRGSSVAAADEVAREDVILEINELTGLTVAPPVHADPGPDVGLHRFVVTERQQPDCRGERDDSKLERLLDIGAVRIHKIRVQGRHGALVEPDSQTPFDDGRQREKPFTAESNVIELTDVNAS